LPQLDAPYAMLIAPTSLSAWINTPPLFLAVELLASSKSCLTKKVTVFFMLPTYTGRSIQTEEILQICKKLKKFWE